MLMMERQEISSLLLLLQITRAHPWVLLKTLIPQLGRLHMMQLLFLLQLLMVILFQMDRPYIY